MFMNDLGSSLFTSPLLNVLLQAISSISVRPDSPQWLLEEVAATRKGLMELCQNVVLLRDPDDPERLYPRLVKGLGSWGLGLCFKTQGVVAVKAKE
jgi:hypothetical protein